jgi:hypothetical protein
MENGMNSNGMNGALPLQDGGMPGPPSLTEGPSPSPINESGNNGGGGGHGGNNAAPNSQTPGHPSFRRFVNPRREKKQSSIHGCI